MVAGAAMALSSVSVVLNALGWSVNIIVYKQKNETKVESKNNRKKWSANLQKCSTLFCCKQRGETN